MQRGIIELDASQANLASFLAENTDADLTALRAKLQLAKSNQTDVSRIEVNREEVEALLDAFPAPSPEQDQSYQLLRAKLQQFLTEKNENQSQMI